MSQATSVARPRPNRLPFVLIIAALVAVGVAVYLMAGPSEQSSERVKLALVTWNEDPFWEPVVRGAQDAADQGNVELTVVQSKPDVEAQSQHIRDLLNKGMLGIAVSPNDPKAQAAVLNDAAVKAALITFDADAPETKRRLFVGIDNYGAGYLAAEEVRTAIPEGGAVIISVGSIEMINGRERRQGLIDGLLERSFKRDRAVDALDAELKGPQYSVVATITDGGDTAKATAQITDAIKAHPETKCIVGLFSYSGPAALTAVEQTGKGGQIKIVGFDETEATQAAIQAGTIHSSILQDQYRCGYEAIRVLADEVRGVRDDGPEGPRVLHVQVSVLRADNIADFRDMKRIRTPGAK